ncbi:MAG: 50S ribosomal protein L5 [Candidatus Saccharimonadales bacterium]
MSRLQEKYQKELVPKLQKELGLKNVHEVPRIEKIVLNIGLGRLSGNPKAFEVAENTLRKITGQNPVKTIAKKSIAGFKLREGQKIGLKVTLRGKRMYEFLDRLIAVVLPRTRDFRGLSRKAFDKNGNYSIGLKEQSVFPELSYDETTLVHGLQVNITTTTSDTEQSIKLLEALGLPIERLVEAGVAAEGEGA